jgi:hypothetical protein
MVLSLAGIALTVPSQTKDMLAALENVRFSIWPTIAFHLALAFLAFSSWFWSRALLAAEHGVPDNQASRDNPKSFGNYAAYRLVPRLIFALAVLIGLVIGIRSGAWFNLVYLLAWAIPLGMLLVFRTSMGIGRRRFALPAWVRTISAPLPPVVQNRSAYRRLAILAASAPISPTLLLGLLALAMTLFLWGSFGGILGLPGLPAFAADIFAGPSVGLVALALIMAPLSVLTFIFDGVNGWATRRAIATDNSWWLLIRHPPVLIALLGWILIMPTVVSLHSVRIVQPQQALVGPPERADLNTMFQDWAETCYLPSGEVQPIILALSGGATRAGIWGERVLSEVEEATSGTGPQIFAVTSVSGGSLGAAAYFSALAAMPDRERCRLGQPNPARQAQLQVLAAPQLSEDALGPAIAGALLNDIPRAIFALILPDKHGRPDDDDRAAALEHGFEHLWKEVSRQYRPDHLIAFSAPYLSLFYEDDRGTLRPGMPVWIGNGTDSATGSRLLTTPFRSSATWPFLAAKDVLGILQADVPISTAVNNTARFPYLDPVGELWPLDISGDTKPFRLNHVPQTNGAAYEIQDGGYFDNDGLQTAMDLATWLREDGPALLRATWRMPGDGELTVDPIIVLATSDGDAIPVETIPRCRPLDDDPVAPSESDRPVQALAPPLSLYNLRAGHAAVLIRQVRDAFCPAPSPSAYRCDSTTGLPIRCTNLDGVGQRFFHFYLPADGTHPIPLNWILSEGTARFIWNDAMQQAGNAEESWLMHRAFEKNQLRQKAPGQAKPPLLGSALVPPPPVIYPALGTRASCRSPRTSKS